MCKHSYEKILDKTNKVMICCKLKSLDNNLLNICVGQKFCEKKDKYIPHNQSVNCKFFEC